MDSLSRNEPYVYHYPFPSNMHVREQIMTQGRVIVISACMLKSLNLNPHIPKIIIALYCTCFVVSITQENKKIKKRIK